MKTRTSVDFYYNLEIDELFNIAEDVKAVTNSGK
jgi:hypothetical protein